MALDIPTGRVRFSLAARHDAVIAARAGRPCPDPATQRLAVAWARRSQRVADIAEFGVVALLAGAIIVASRVPDGAWVVSPADEWTALIVVLGLAVVVFVAMYVAYRRMGAAMNWRYREFSDNANVQAVNLTALLERRKVAARPLDVRRAAVNWTPRWQVLAMVAIALAAGLSDVLALLVFCVTVAVGAAYAIVCVAYPLRLVLGPEGLTLPLLGLTVPWDEIPSVELIGGQRVHIVWAVLDSRWIIAQAHGGPRRLGARLLVRRGEFIAIPANQLREPPEVVVPVSRAWIAKTASRPEEPAEAPW